LKNPLNKETFAEKIDRAKAETNKPTFAKPYPTSPPKAKTAPSAIPANSQAANLKAELKISFDTETAPRIGRASRNKLV
jgi:hypothetical protein